nr:PAS domain S-box protein [Desulfobacula sp.]
MKKTPLTILYLEDSPPDFELVSETLAKAGFDPKMSRVETEQDFISSLIHQKYQMILADFKLPGYDAFAALGKSAEICPDTPFIVVSGSIGEDTAIELIKQGAVDYVLKDKLDRLPFTLQRALEEASQKKARKKAEEDLAANYALLCIAGETAKFGGWSVDLRNNTGAWSDTVADIHDMPRGYSPSVKEAVDFYAPECRERISAVFMNCAKNGVPYDEEMEILTRTGKRVWVRTNGVAVRDENGKIVKVQGSFQDITEKKKGEARQERLAAAIEQSGEAVIITDPEGKIQYVNPAFEKATGYTREEVLGQNPRILNSGRQDEAFYHGMWSTLLKKETFHGRMVNKRKDGALFTEEAAISPVFDTGGRLINYVAVKRDITAQIQLEEQYAQAQKMESVGRLAGGVAHDFNNMLTIILSYTQMALTEIDPASPAHKDLKQVLNAAGRSAEITRQLLAFARKQTVSPRVLDLNETVEHMLKMLRRLMGEDITLTYMPGSGVWPVMMDPSQIDQILANLCVNARDAIAGVGKVTIRTDHLTLDEADCAGRPGMVPGEFVLLTVSDTGCGMAKEILDHIYEPFFTTKGTGQGTGLGLATVYGIVKQNNGFISAYSEPGQGTAFRIYLPRHAGETHPSHAADETKIPLGRNETILIVEDEAPILKMAQRTLEELNYCALAETNPDRALDLAQNHSGPIHLSVIDVVMPRMNGPELARKLKAIHPDLKILFMSGYTADVIAHRGILEDGVNFISKPFSRRDLAQKIREVLDQGPGPLIVE